MSAPSAPGDDDVEIALEAVQVDAAAGVGRVVRAGARARGLVDRRVLLGPIDPCGECDVCRRGGAAAAAADGATGRPWRARHAVSATTRSSYGIMLRQ